ncbi:MAG: tol-pal system protein YbgF [Desulfobacterales bacterium]|nr:MAG: tol-pal system protein YbgF [Desulfobacterales bacterium]
MRANIGASWMALVVTGLIFLGGCAFQDDLIALEDRVIVLERQSEEDRASLRSDVERYQEDQAKSDQDSRSRHAELRALANDLREEIGQLRGELEQGQHGAKSLEGSVQSTLDRVARIEQYLGIGPSEKPAASDVDQDEAANGAEGVEETPEALYARAKKGFDQGQYENARELFRSFLKQYPKSEMADSAQFWLGEIYYHEKWYEKAILEYQKVIEDYPKGNKIPSALLKQGFAFLNLGDNANAGLILKELIRKFPDSNEANVAKNKLKTLK